MDKQRRAIEEAVALMRQASERLRTAGHPELANELARVTAKANREAEHKKAVEGHPDLFKPA
jgi:hypothetical protein